MAELEAEEDALATAKSKHQKRLATPVAQDTYGESSLPAWDPTPRRRF